MRLTILLKGRDAQGFKILGGTSASADKNFNITATSGLSTILLACSD